MSIETTIFLIGISAFLGLIPAAIAHNKGHSFLNWWAAGFMLFIVALPYAMALPTVERDEGTFKVRRCPSCLETVRVEAKVCRHCRRDLPPAFNIPEKYDWQKLPPELIRRIQSRPAKYNLDHAKTHIRSQEWHEAIAILQFIVENEPHNSKEYGEAYSILYRMVPA